jgi:hypothetical protein
MSNIKSTAIHSVSANVESAKLYLVFTSNLERTYTYDIVSDPESVLSEFSNTDSYGKTYHKLLAEGAIKKED